MNSLIQMFVDWLFGSDKEDEKEVIPQMEAPVPNEKNIEKIKNWLSTNSDHQELITYYRYAEGKKAKAEILEIVKIRLIEICDSISPTLKDAYFPPD